MLNAIRLHKIVEKDGEICLTGLPYSKGQSVELILLKDQSTKEKKDKLTVNNLLKSGIIGMWKDRPDIEDSSIFARKLREETQTRKR